MIDFKDVYFIIRNHIARRTGIALDKVIPAMTTNVKPKGVYATFDVLLVSDASGYTLNKRFDPLTNEFVYETVKDVVVQISVRNGSPDNTEDKMNVISLANNLHKSFAEDSTLLYLSENLGASVKALDPLRSAGDDFPTAVGKVEIFQVRLAMMDITREYVGSITNVQIEGTAVDGNVSIDGVVNVNTDISTSVVFSVTSSDPSVNTDLSFYTKSIEGRGEASIVSDTITLPEDFEFDIQLYQYNGDTSVITLLDDLILEFRTEVGLNKVGVSYGGDPAVIYDIDISNPITIRFRDDSVVEVVNDSTVITSFSLTYVGTETEISLDFEGLSVLSKTVLKFN